VTGQAAIQHDLDPVFSADLKKGESIALPIALLVLLAVFGLSGAVTIPFLFAGATIMGTLGLVFAIAHELSMATYVTNLVQLVGLGIAVDYSLLMIYRFREELERGGSTDDAVVRTMTTAGRAVVFSGATVAIGLSLLLFIPLPFVRMGVAGSPFRLSDRGRGTLQPVLWPTAAAARLAPGAAPSSGDPDRRRLWAPRASDHAAKSSSSRDSASSWGVRRLDPAHPGVDLRHPAVAVGEGSTCSRAVFGRVAPRRSSSRARGGGERPPDAGCGEAARRRLGRP
jgi:hypothetical protein